jgi:hypothetical protein
VDGSWCAAAGMPDVSAAAGEVERGIYAGYATRRMSVASGFDVRAVDRVDRVMRCCQISLSIDGWMRCQPSARCSRCERRLAWSCARWRVGLLVRARRYSTRVDTTDDPRLSKLLFARIGVAVVGGMARVFARQSVEVLECSLLQQCRIAADLNVAAGVIRITTNRLTFRSRCMFLPLLRWRLVLMHAHSPS